MDVKEEAEYLVETFRIGMKNGYFAKNCALICLVTKYNSLRELLFNLRSCRVIESEKVYLHRLDELIKHEYEVKQEINKL
jgi:hypothetical protein